MTWARDDTKLDRVRALMAERELDALVVRAPDNVLYLTNFWGMKGYDACVFPREGEPVLITIEASEEDAARTAWTEDVRLIRGYDPEDPRPPLARTLDAAVAAARDFERVGLDELPQVFNVLRAEMSLVGPRPAPLEDVHELLGAQRRTLGARPGMTGRWQIAWARGASESDMRIMDADYLRRWRITHDLDIMIRTPIAILGRRFYMGDTEIKRKRGESS